MGPKSVGTQSRSFLTQAVEDVIGRPSLVWIASIVREALFGNLEMSFEDRYVTWIFGDSVPQCLQISNLLRFG